MESVRDKFEELNLSRDEVERIGDALKNKEFRQLLVDYVEEIQDPENRKLYQEEIKQLEKERGMDVTFINPEPGYVIKTSVDGSTKAFINVCMNDNIQKPSSKPRVQDGSRGLQWSLPHSLAPPREDIDNKRNICNVYDVVFHPDTLHLAEKNKPFFNMVNTIACDAVESSFDVTLDKKNLKFPKLKYKGSPHAAVIRKPSSEKPKERTEEEQEFFDKLYKQVDEKSKESEKCYKKNKTAKQKSMDDDCFYTTPKYVIKHKNHIELQDFTRIKPEKFDTTIPKELVLEVSLPLLKSSTEISLDVTEKTVQLVSEKPAKYKLNITLPFPVNQDIGNAKFDKDVKKLIVNLPVKRKLVPLRDSADSGVESDTYTQSSPEAETCKDITFLVDERTSEKQMEIFSDNFTKTTGENCIQNPSDNPLQNSSDICAERVSDHSETQSKQADAFLDDTIQYVLPEYASEVFGNGITFKLHVKNVDIESVRKILDPIKSDIHLKFTSIGASFYPVHYAFFVKFPGNRISRGNDLRVETRNKYVILKIPFEDSIDELQSYYVGINSDDLTVKQYSPLDDKKRERPLNDQGSGAPNEGIICKMAKEYNDEEMCSTTQTLKGARTTDISAQSMLQEHLPTETMERIFEQDETEPAKIDNFSVSYESSCDELSYSYSPSKGKGILKRASKRQFGRSKSESCLDDFMCGSSSVENCFSGMDSDIPEDCEISCSLKKTVRFNDVVSRQLYRSNSSILGQRKKNQRKAKNKKKAQMRRSSESDMSEAEEAKKTDDGEEIDTVSREDSLDNIHNYDSDIFEIDV